MTSRRRRPLDRKIDHLRDTKLVIIATEGTKTEKQYFESDLFRSSRVQVKVLETVDGRSAPNHVLGRLKDFAKETNLQPDDQLWLVVDKDRWEDRLLRNISGQAIRRRKVKAQLAVSNPCFELWLYLHTEQWRSRVVSCREMEQALRGLLGEYNKSNLKIEFYSDRVETAVENAIKIDTNPTGWPGNPGTHVYRVVNAIREIMGSQ